MAVGLFGDVCRPATGPPPAWLGLGVRFGPEPPAAYATAPRSVLGGRRGRRARDVAQERCRVQPTARRGLDDRNRVEAAAVAVDLLAQPLPDLGDIAGGQRLVARAELGLQRLPHLRRDQA